VRFGSERFTSSQLIGPKTGTKMAIAIQTTSSVGERCAVRGAADADQSDDGECQREDRCHNPEHVVDRWDQRIDRFIHAAHPSSRAS